MTALDLHVSEAVTYNPYRLYHLAEIDGHAFSFSFKKEPVFETARLLLARGYHPRTVLRPMRNGRPTFKPSTLEKFAKLTVEETEERGPRIRPFRPRTAGKDTKAPHSGEGRTCGADREAKWADVRE